MLSRQFLVEAAMPDIGRKYQHLEDLVYTNGSQGALHAIERLRRLPTEYQQVEVKWDGSPVFFWGRDDEGQFYFFPKNAWQYQQRGKNKTADGVSTEMSSAAAVKKFISGTGRADTPEQQAQRNQYAQGMSQLYSVFERATPDDFRGFVEGGLLFYPEKPAIAARGEYTFQPNVTRFYVRQDSRLGERIENATAGVAITGYYPELGSTQEQRLSTDQIDAMNHTPALVVQGPLYVETVPVLDPEMDRALAALEQSILKNRTVLDNYLSPKPGLKSPGSVIYKFMGDQRATKFADLTGSFPAWAKQNLSAKQADVMLSDPAGLSATLGAVEQLQKIKDSVLDQWLTGIQQHSIIRQDNPEGFAQPDPGGYQYAIPGQFVKYIKRSDWQPR